MEILVVDDHVLIREALRGVLRELKGEAIVLEASSCNQAMQVIAEHPNLDLILLDLNLPDRDGFSMLTELGERYPAISVVVLSAQQDRGSVVRALDLGALGFIPKSGQREVMLRALELVFAGGTYIPPEILARDEPSARQRDEKQPATNRPSVSPADLGLTERQVDVLSLMMRGKSNKAICRVLNLAEPFGLIELRSRELSVGDAVIWDNRATQHKAIDDYGHEPRIVRRVTIDGPVSVGIDGRHGTRRSSAAQVTAAA